MQEQIPSRTAWRVAARRAAHQIFDHPLVFDDPLALPILGADGASLIEREADRENTRVARALRAFMAARSRFAEDELSRAVQRGVRQYVLLGAGLDTFAYRNPFAADRLRVFEVDHPATQAWKRHLLERAGIGHPPSLTYVPVDFEQQTIARALDAAGMNPAEPAFFSWLGVTMYLARETVMSVFEFVARCPPGGGIVFDYAISPSLLGFTERLVLNAFARRVAAIGEPWTTFFRPDELTAELQQAGYRDIEDLGPETINRRYFENRADGLEVGSLAHLMKAVV